MTLLIMIVIFNFCYCVTRHHRLTALPAKAGGRHPSRFRTTFFQCHDATHGNHTTTGWRRACCFWWQWHLNKNYSFENPYYSNGRQRACCFCGSGILASGISRKTIPLKILIQIFPKTWMPECHSQDATDVTIILIKNNKKDIRKSYKIVT
jgi:hypothetical protein